MRKPEDIMADYLLKGGKMLEKTCPGCGSPLFIVKGETVCVVCAENTPVATGKPPASESVISNEISSSGDKSVGGNIGASAEPLPVDNAAVNGGRNTTGVYSGGIGEGVAEKISAGNNLRPDSLYYDIEETMKELCRRIRNTANSGDCLTYMNCIKAGTEALNELKK